MIDELHAEADDKREADGKPPLGREAVLAQDPFARVHSKRGHAPSVLALDPEVHRTMRAELRARVQVWREAAEAAMRLVAGKPHPSYRWQPTLFWRALAL